MAEYIDREAAKKIIKKHMTKTANEFKNKDYNTQSIIRKIYLIAIDHAIEFLSIIPAADVVEVVRCKDCAYYSDFDAYAGKRFNFHFCKKFNNITLESDFCSYGEKMDGKGKDHE